MKSKISTYTTIKGKITSFTGTRAEFHKYLMNEVSKIPYKNYYIYMKYKENDHLIMSSLNRDVLIDMIPFGNEVMNSYIIAEYLLDKKEFSQLLTTVEWSTHPEKRKQQLLNNKSPKFKVLNLKLYSDNEAQNIIPFNSYEDGNVKTKKMAG